jgi:hypothetical protein
MLKGKLAIVPSFSSFFPRPLSAQAREPGGLAQ